MLFVITVTVLVAAVVVVGVWVEAGSSRILSGNAVHFQAHPLPRASGPVPESYWPTVTWPRHLCLCWAQKAELFIADHLQLLLISPPDHRLPIPWYISKGVSHEGVDETKVRVAMHGGILHV